MISYRFVTFSLLAVVRSKMKMKRERKALLTRRHGPVVFLLLVVPLFLDKYTEETYFDTTPPPLLSDDYL